MDMRRRLALSTAFAAAIILSFVPHPVPGQEAHGQTNREAVDRMRDRDLRPEKILEAIGLEEGMRVGEAGASYGYFTFKMSRRVGNSGVVYANDIDARALRQIEQECAADGITNVRTVLGAEVDPRFPVKDLDMIVVFDCLFEFSKPTEWMSNARGYLGKGGHLVVVDPDPAKMGGGEHFLSREEIVGFAKEAGYEPVKVDDSFLKSHMIVMLRPDQEGGDGQIKWGE